MGAGAGVVAEAAPVAMGDVWDGEDAVETGSVVDGLVFTDARTNDRVRV